MRFAHPAYLLLFVPAAALLYLYLRGHVGKEAVFRYSSLKLVADAGGRRTLFSRLFRGFVRFLVLGCLILALARPQTGSGEESISKRVIDIVIALDISGSMATVDFQPDNRLTAAKIEARKFIDGRPDDRIGLVVFAGQSFTQCPLTVDHGAILSLLDKIRIGMVEDGTAIGLGLGNAVNRLKYSEAKNKVVILLTDGVNNAGEIDPRTAAELARRFKIRVYTVGVGNDGESFLPVRDPRYGTTRLLRVETQIDEKLLREIAKKTGGAYFRARDERALADVFRQIDKLERTEVSIERFTRHDERFYWFLWPALFLLLLELFWAHVLTVKLP